MIDRKTLRPTQTRRLIPLGAAVGVLVALATPVAAACEAKTPIVVDLATEGSRTYFEFASDDDAIFVNSGGVKTSILRIDGGRNITILGGAFVPGEANSAATINLQGVSGDVHVEGVRIDNAGTGGRDGIGVAGREGHAPAVTIRNSSVENVQGSYEGVHGDIFQPYGPIASLTVNGFSGSSSYQGFFLDPQFEPLPLQVSLSNVNLAPNPSEVSKLQPKLLWFYAADAPAKYPVRLTNVHIVGRTPAEAVGNVFPTDAILEGNTMGWPGLPIEGVITVGPPADGDFAKRETVGEAFDYQVALFWSLTWSQISFAVMQMTGKCKR